MTASEPAAGNDTRLRVYIETSVVSYLTGRPSRNLLAVLRQKLTKTWWRRRRHDFRLHTSQLVIGEASSGDSAAAKRRLNALLGIPIVVIRPDVTDLADAFIVNGYLPPQAVDDAVHIALSTVHGMDFLLTWNLTHIANAEVRRAIARYCASLKLQPPTICTPEELLGK